MKQAHTASVLGLALVGLMAAAVAAAMFGRDPAARRPAMCPDPDPRAGVVVDGSLNRLQLAARLREVRARFRLLHPGELPAGPGDDPGPAAALDRMLGELISDCLISTREDTP